MTGALAEALAGTVRGGGKAFLPYVTGGLPGVDGDLLQGLAATADAIEIGIPFSDPVMDGPVIQEASQRALEAGTTVERVLDLVLQASPPCPMVAMTYLNPVLAYGEERFAADAADAGVAGVIVPDLPLDEASAWLETCRRRSLEPVLLAAPNTGPERLARIAAASGGFVYCVAGYGVTGRRERLEGSAEDLVAALRPLTSTPLLVGVGISAPPQAAEACRFADGVIVGSALVEPLLRGAPEECLERARGFRVAVPRPEPQPFDAPTT